MGCVIVIVCHGDNPYLNLLEVFLGSLKIFFKFCSKFYDNRSQHAKNVIKSENVNILSYYILFKPVSAKKF